MTDTPRPFSSDHADAAKREEGAAAAHALLKPTASAAAQIRQASTANEMNTAAETARITKANADFEAGAAAARKLRGR